MRPTLFWCLLTPVTLANIVLDLSSQDSIKSAAATIAAGLRQQYTGDRPGDVPGNLPQPYYWWEAGAMFGAFIDYYYFTGDDTYNAITTQAMLHQVGPNSDFMPPNQTKTLGNDDQAFWAFAALSAAENRFPNPPESSGVSWLALAQAVWNSQAARWDMSTCGGGLRWQIFSFNGGYNYKNTISNGAFFQIGARLAVYTRNQTYYDHAARTWDWAASIGLIDAQYNFFDGSDDLINCTEIDRLQWTYNAGTFLAGAANMYNFTTGATQQMWETRINGIIGRIEQIFVNGTALQESACEQYGSCNVDQRSFKAYLARWMASTIVRAPFTRSRLKPILESSALAAVRTCTGGSDGNQCGQKWTVGGFDGATGVGEQMCALEIVQVNLLDYAEGPATEINGISPGDPTAGTRSTIGPGDLFSHPVSTSDKIGAAVFTIILVAGFVGCLVWIVL